MTTPDIRPRNIYLIGICGTAMASLAGMLQAQGHRVTGSDAAAYPPMSDMLAQLGIPLREPYAESQPHPAARPRRGRQRDLARQRGA